MLSSSSIIFERSSEYLIPSPSQALQAPFGELNEKLSGSSGSKLILQSKQAKCSL